MLALQSLTFAFTLWLGLYLITRDPRNRPQWLAGLGVLAYALALAAESIAGDLWGSAWENWRWPFLCLPAALWLAALVQIRRTWTGVQPRDPKAVIVVATLFFGLGLGLILFPLGWLPRTWVLFAISFDFLALGLAIARLDAFEAGERLWPDMRRSFAATAFAVLLFGGIVALAMIATGATVPMRLLWLAVVAAAVAVQALAEPLQGALDRLTLTSGMSAARAELRATASALPRTDAELDLDALDEAEFARLTRRALSNVGDLSRLAASPLTRLPAVLARLTARGARDDNLERAQELKALLAESIARLKPRAKGEFGTSDEWRHYNALYFPYVLGLKPYARRFEQNGLDETAHAALEWFRVSVPERTLHNWQNAAARLVARDIRRRDG